MSGQLKDGSLIKMVTVTIQIKHILLFIKMSLSQTGSQLELESNKMSVFRGSIRLINESVPSARGMTSECK